MQMRLPIAVAALAVVGAGVCPLAAQRRGPGNPGRMTAPKPPNIGGQRQNPERENPAKELERFQKMSPQDREKALSKLPAARRARVEQQLQRLDSMTPEQRERQLRRVEAFQSLPPERRKVVQQEIQDIRTLPPVLRRDRLYGEQMKQFSPEEQQLIRGSFPRLTEPKEQLP